MPNAGSSVTVRRSNRGTRIRKSPCMISAPAYAPTAVEASPDANNPTAKSVATTGPSTAPMARYAPSSSSVPGTALRVVAASSKRARFTDPAIAIATATSMRVIRTRPSLDKSLPPFCCRRRRKAVAAQRGMRIDGVRHDRRTQNGCREQHRARICDARHQPTEHRAQGGRCDKNSDRESNRDNNDEPDDDDLKQSRTVTTLHKQQEDRRHSGSNAAPNQRHTEQQV